MCSFRMDSSILAVNRQIYREAQDALHKHNVWEVWTAELVGNITWDMHSNIFSKVWYNTTITLEQHLSLGHIRMLHLVIDTTSIHYSSLYSPHPNESLFLGERLFLKHGLRYISKLLAQMPRPPRILISWLDDGIWVWEERRKWMFGEVLRDLPSSCSYEVRALPGYHMISEYRTLFRFPRWLFIQTMKADLGIEVQG